MTTQPSRDLFDDLVADIPAHVTADPTTAWQAGRRRRLRVRVGTAAAVVVAVALLASFVGVLPRPQGIAPADTDRTSVGGYPQRIEYPYLAGDLPDRPGTVAGLLQDGLGWRVVSATGHVWQLDDNLDVAGWVPAISPDGRRIAYLRDDEVYVIRDLVDGTVVEFPDVGFRSPDPTATYFISPQSPPFFSPDGTRLLAHGGLVDGPSSGDLLLGLDGSVVTVPTPPRAQFPAGWSGPDTLVWAGSRQLVTTDLSGAELTRVTHDVQPQDFGQWTASTSPDGRSVAYSQPLDDGAGSVKTVDLATGAAPASTIVTSFSDSCSVAWRGDEPLAPASVGPRGALHAFVRLLGDTDDQPVVVGDWRLGAYCSLWASDALAGDEHRGLAARIFGTSDLKLTWLWREELAGLLLLLGAVTWWVRRYRRSHSARRIP